MAITKKREFPVHVILGMNYFIRMKPQERPRMELPSGPIAELTKLDRVILSSGKENT